MPFGFMQRTGNIHKDAKRTLPPDICKISWACLGITWTMSSLWTPPGPKRTTYGKSPTMFFDILEKELALPQTIKMRVSSQTKVDYLGIHVKNGEFND